MARRSHLVPRKPPKPRPKLAVVEANPATQTPYAKELIRAQRETLRILRHTQPAHERALLARALRDLREVYHMVTGELKPGMRQPGKPGYYERRMMTQAIPIQAQISNGEPVQPAATGESPPAPTEPAKTA